MTPTPTIPAELLDVVKAARALQEAADKLSSAELLRPWRNNLRQALANLDRKN